MNSFIMARNVGVDILKFIAVLLITNSHLSQFYPDNISFLATGGAIGDALFFFCSGFTLFLKPMGRFDNWYKKRVSRIYPTVFSWAIILAFILEVDNDMSSVIMSGGGLFVSCIMVYYIIIYLVNRFASKYLYQFFTFYLIFLAVVYFLWNKDGTLKLYSFMEYSYACVFYFLFMILGAIIGKNGFVVGFRKSIIGFVISIVLFYALIFLSDKVDELNHLQLLSSLPLLAIVLFLYTLCSSTKIKSLIDKKYIGWIIKFIGGLCLDIYIVQLYLLRNWSYNVPFPANMIAILTMIVLMAYLLRCTARLFSQTFNKQDYNWKEIFKMV